MNQRKVAQRSKGNVKPSSSARAAELLAQKSVSTEGFGVGLSFSPDSSASADDSSSVLNDPHIKAALKQLGKKDSVTRLKAMREIINLVQNSEETDCSTAFSVWIKGYNRLSMSSNFKVRELCHQTTAVFCAKLGKSVKPFVKSIVPIMVFGESDSYGNVSAAAKDSLVTVFGADKRHVVLTSCSSEIITLCSDLLMDTNIAKYIEKGSEVEEDSETHSQRLSCCSLATLQLLVSDTSGDINTLTLIHSTLLSNAKFWNIYAKHKLPAVRGSFMKFLSVLCQFNSKLSSIGDHLVPAVVNNLDDQDILVRSNAWSSLLHGLRNLPRLLTFINIQKALLPAVYIALKYECYGFATVVGPCVSLIFEKLPSEMTQPRERLLKELSESVKMGLVSEKNPANVAFILSSFLSCCSMVTGETKIVAEAEIAEVLTAVLKSSGSLFDSVCPLITSLISKNENSLKLPEFRSMTATVNPVNLAKLLTSLKSDHLCDFCCSIYSDFKETQEPTNLRALLWVFRNASSPELLERFYAGAKPEFYSAFQFVHTEVIGRLQQAHPTVEVMGLLVDLAFIMFDMYESLNDAEKLMCLNDLAMIEDDNLCFHVLKNLNTVQSDPIVTQWIRSPSFSPFFLNSFKLMCLTTESLNHWKDVEPFMRTGTLTNEVLDQCALSLVESLDLFASVTDLCHVAFEVIDHNEDLILLEGWQQLLIKLFVRWMNSTGSDTDQLQQCWSRGLKASLKTTGGFMSKNSFLSQVGEKFQRLSLMTTFQMPEFTRFVDNGTIILRSIDNCFSSDERSEVSLAFLSKLMCSLEHFETFLGDKLLIERAVTEGVIFPGIQKKSSSMKLKELLSGLVMAVNVALFQLRLCESYLTPPEEYEWPSAVTEKIISAGAYAWVLLTVMEELESANYHIMEFNAVHKELWRCVQLWFVQAQFENIAERILNESTSKGGIIAVTLRNIMSKTGGKKVRVMLDSFVHSLRDREATDLGDSVIETGMVNNLLGGAMFSLHEKDSAVNGGDRFVVNWVYKLSLASTATFEDQIAGINDFFNVKAQLEDRLLLNENHSFVNVTEDIRLQLTLVGALQALMIQLIPSMAKLSSEQRDFIMCCLITWLQVLDGSSIKDQRSKLFALKALKMYNRCVALAESIAADNAVEQQFSVEWREFFSDSAASLVLNIFVQLADEKEETGGGMYLTAKVFSEASVAVSSLSKEQLLNNNLMLTLCPEMDLLKYSEKLQTVLLHTIPALNSSPWSIQLGAYRVLKKLTGELWQFESQMRLNEESTQKDGKDVERPLPFSFVWLLNECDPGDIQFLSDDANDIDSPNVERKIHKVCGYLLTWKLLVDYMASVPAEEMFSYSVALKESGLLQKIILLLFSIMPDNVSVLLKDNYAGDWEMFVTPDGNRVERPVLNEKEIFVAEPEFTFDECQWRDMEILSCNLYYLLLRRFPALIRQWWNNQERKIANTIERFTAKNVSSLMCQEEIQAVGKTQTQVENLKILPRPNAREVVAIYSTEDINMELVVSLPVNHPLGSITVESGKRVGVAKEQWRQWMLQLNVFLMHQNGSLLSGIVLWKRNIDKHLEGVDDCMICMMAIHGSNHQLPRVCCRQCKKKFHSACLYKWFNTSNNASCPMCRSVF